MNILMMLLVGAVVGWLASLIVKGEGMGILGNIIVGIVGSSFGTWIAGKFNIQASDWIGSLIISVGGAVILLVLIRAIFGRKKSS